MGLSRVVRPVWGHAMTVFHAEDHTGDHAGMTGPCRETARRRPYIAAICKMETAMTSLKTALLALVGAATLAMPAAALEPLSSEKYINDRLIAARIADRIRRECPSIDGRLVYAYSQARALQRYALDKGYSRAQVDAFLDSRTEKDRIYAVAEQYMAQNGVTKGDAESFCRLGRAEIGKRTVTGSLLVAR